MKIGILYICTGKYRVFWKDFYLSCEKNFITEAEKRYFVFTDSPEIEFEKDNENITKISQVNLGWPNNTLMRFEMFSKIQRELSDFDYIFFFNADLICLEKISASDFLPLAGENLVATLHPGYFNKKRNEFPYENNKLSTAYIDKFSGQHYFAGGLNGGRSKFFIQAILDIKKSIDQDIKNNIIAKWHDESHWNKYLISRKDVKILNPGYLYPEADILPFKRNIMIRDKRKYFSYQDLGKSNSSTDNDSYQKIKLEIEKIGYIQRSLLWQLFKKWLNRLTLLRTIYRNSKKEAIRAYLKNDYDYFKVRKEIDSFRINGIYNFGGAKLPFSVITADTYFNVLKPNIVNIDYSQDSLEKFYSDQKEKYKSLTFWKDNYTNREPDYIGGHIISHGFTYFFKEINISKDDVVIDLGAAPGDFSAVCIQKGASQVYAFEPEERSSSDLEKVSLLNENKITIIRKYSGAETKVESNTTTLDDFVKTNKIININFIKADIEGAEPNVLFGAKHILKTFKPKLSICTYHSVNDEKEIEKIILGTNPSYKIYKQKGIIYAY